VTKARAFTPEQLDAIERRSGDLLLDASAGSGKTSVLVERFVRAVLEDGVAVGAILTITFTDKAAAELRDRIRRRLRELGAGEAARATEGAFISTIHGFCARVLRAHALAAGIDPLFVVLDSPAAERLANEAFEDALEDLANNAPGGLSLIASYGTGALDRAILGTYDELRSRGQRRPRLPPLDEPPDLDAARDELLSAAAQLAEELGAVANPGVRVVQMLERLDRCAAVVAAADVWPAELAAIAAPGGNGAALSSTACERYSAAFARFRSACEHRRASVAHDLLDRLLVSFGERYEERKRAVSGLDFEDLELLCAELLAPGGELRDRYRRRFTHVMVDEFQDVNGVQLALIESVADENLFTVGDAQQSIYGFRHADVELFERRAERLAAAGACATLRTNFRSRPEILAVLNGGFGAAIGERFRPLRPGREAAGAGAPSVELLIADKGADWIVDGLASPWRIAEARALAARVRELVAEGVQPRQIVVLNRATTDLRVYERALEDVGVPTYVIGGRGYWAHPQVVDLVAYLRLLANPLDEEALFGVLASPLVGVSYDALVVLAAAARGSGHDPWAVLSEPDSRLHELSERERARLAAFALWAGPERDAAVRVGIDELIERALAHSGYDLTMLAMPGGERRLANVRKLMRLGRAFEARAGHDLRGFLELVRARSGGWDGGADSRESEAPVEGEALDAVRLMTIHRAKGLEFDVVCVADLGRGPIRPAPLIRIGRDGRFGLRLAQPGTGRREPALDYRALGEEQQRFEDAEERRLFYVAMTRSRERLLLSGAARLDPWGGGGPIGWIAPALVPEIAERAASAAAFVSDGGVDVRFVQPGEAVAEPGERPGAAVVLAECHEPVEVRTSVGLPVGRLSYTSLAEYDRCGYRFYAERVLRLAPVAERAGTQESSGGLSAIERGVIVHALLQELDFRRPVPPAPAAVHDLAAALGFVPTDQDAADSAALVQRFAASELCARLGRATGARREERFTFLLGEVLIAGAFDVLAREPAGTLLVVDYKTDRLSGVDPTEVVASAYATQRLVYALAALHAGAESVDVVHVFLELPAEPVLARYKRTDAERLTRELAARADGVLGRRFSVTDVPHSAICRGCPAEGGLCSWPVAMTRRDPSS
jgi:ATP-dependent exoDNAse (exonuclease V) beta subunit